MKIDGKMLEMMDGKGLGDEIMVAFPVPPVAEIEIRPNVIFRLCAEQSVIHLGCTDHLPIIDMRIAAANHLHRQLSFVASECIGVDINREAVLHLYRQGITNVLAADLTQPGLAEIEARTWDWLLVPDVLEHIANPAQFLRGIMEAYGKYIKRVLISVPNAFGSAVYGSESFAQEVINYDHCHWYTPYTLCKVVKAAGLRPDELFMCQYENPTEAILANGELYKRFPLLLNTIVLTADAAS